MAEIFDPITGRQSTTFLPIYLDSLLVDTILDFDLYLKVGNEVILYRSKRLPFSEESRAKLLENNIHILYVASDSKKIYQQYIETNLGNIIQDPTIEEEKKAGIIYDTSKALVKDVLANPELGENIQRSKDMVTNQVGYILKGREAFLNLMKITSFDYYTYTHSVNVCTFAIALAHQLGLTDNKALHDLGLGALLHDVGKSRISERILNKRAPLNRAEISIVRKHPNWGMEILNETDILNDEAYYPVIQHHERLNGSGYPNELKEKDIHPYGKIIAVCDVFDALTTRRVYQDALATYNALKTMFENKEEFDSRILEEFVRLMGPQ